MASKKKQCTKEAEATQLEIEDERREQALTDALLDGHPEGDEWGLGNSWDWAGGD